MERYSQNSDDTTLVEILESRQRREKAGPFPDGEPKKILYKLSTHELNDAVDDQGLAAKMDAAKTLYSVMQKAGDYSASTFRAGLFLMAGILFSIRAVVDASKHLLYGDLIIQVQTSYLLQVRDKYHYPLQHTPPTYHAMHKAD